MATVKDYSYSKHINKDCQNDHKQEDWVHLQRRYPIGCHARSHTALSCALGISTWGVSCLCNRNSHKIPSLFSFSFSFWFFICKFLTQRGGERKGRGRGGIQTSDLGFMRIKNIVKTQISSRNIHRALSM